MGKKVILIVDDQLELRNLILLTLDGNDYELHTANDGQQALTMAKQFHPDLMILDVMMPGNFDGYEVCKELKTNSRLKDIYIILLTARGQQADNKKGFDAGANSYIVKPFSPLELASIVKEALIK
jgi:DNA-binding response OmpR family regulator